MALRGALYGAAAVALLVLLGWCSGYVYVGLDRSGALERADSLQGALDAGRRELARAEAERAAAVAEAQALAEARVQDSLRMAGRVARAEALADSASREADALAEGLARELTEQQRRTLAQIRAADALVLQVEREKTAATAVDRDYWREIAHSWESAYHVAAAEIEQWKARDRIRDELDAALREEVRNRGRQRTVATVIAIGVSAWVGYDELRH